MRIMLSAALIIAVGLLCAQSGYADMKALREDINTLKAGQVTMQKDLEKIKKLLLTRQAKRGPAPFKEAVVSLQGDHTKGNDLTKLVMINFSEYQCPFCARFVRETLPQIEKEYINTSKIRYVFMDFPLAFHAQSLKAAESASCAEEQGWYWEMSDLLFANQDALSHEALLKHGEALGLKMDTFKKCLDSGRFITAIRTSMAEGQKAGITGTPTFLFGFIDQDGKVKATKKIVGAQSYATFKNAIESLLYADKH